MLMLYKSHKMRRDPPDLVRPKALFNGTENVSFWARFIAVAVFSTLCFLIVAQLSHRSIVDSLKRSQLQDLSARTVSRAEVAIDLVVMTMSRMIAEGNIDCGPKTAQALHRATFTVGGLKDLHVFGPAYHCSGFPKLGLVSPQELLNAPRSPSRNSAIELARIKNKEWMGLAVIWTFQNKHWIAAVMSTDSLLFDMLPFELREDASIDLQLHGNTPVAHYQPARWQANRVWGRSTFSSQSKRYPIRVSINANDNALSLSAARPPDLVLGIALLGAVLFGLVAAGSTVRRPDPTDELDRAVRDGEIVPYFQPIVALSSHKIIGCEMLARWIKPDGTQISPAQFIPLAELSDQVDKVTEALLRQAGAGLGAVLRERSSLKMTFNITPQQFLSDDFSARLGGLADKYGLPKQNLVVELTERQEITSIETAQAVTAELRALGMRVAIDDVGTGHNGLSAIKNLGATCMKIDKLFVDEVATDQRTRALFEMLVKIARAYDMTTVAEGIEHAEQAALLLTLGVREGQGYLFSRPLPLVEFCSALENEHKEDAQVQTGTVRVPSPAPQQVKSA